MAVALVGGLFLGLDFPSIAIHTNLLSKLFLKIISVIIAPLVFSTLVVGIARHSDLKQVGRMALKCFIY